MLIGSLKCYIQIEYDLENEEDSEVVCQGYIRNYAERYDIFNDILDIEDGDDEVNVEIVIEELITICRELNRSIGKIHNKIIQIREICEENNMPMDDYIKVVFDFDE